ncbi:hypothetical protein D3C81_896260 [compost metagenome]
MPGFVKQQGTVGVIRGVLGYRPQGDEASQGPAASAHHQFQSAGHDLPLQAGVWPFHQLANPLQARFAQVPQAFLELGLQQQGLCKVLAEMFEPAVFAGHLPPGFRCGRFGKCTQHLLHYGVLGVELRLLGLQLGQACRARPCIVTQIGRQQLFLAVDALLAPAVRQAFVERIEMHLVLRQRFIGIDQPSQLLAQCVGQLDLQLDALAG